uniref:Uncharacterized protein n=1 Tax=Arundo donax TaxID=35708 RepID=A0A0A9H5B0_ARUDO
MVLVQSPVLLAHIVEPFLNIQKRKCSIVKMIQVCIWKIFMNLSFRGRYAS